MNALGAGLGSNLPSGWVVGGFCWFVLRVLRRLDDLEKEQGETREAVESIHRRLRDLQEKS